MKNNKKKMILGIGVLLLIAALLLTIHHLHSGHEHSEHEHGEVSTEMTLNNGEKWKADIQTKRFVMAMIHFVEKVSVKENLTKAEYIDAGETLKGSFNSIIANCTMEGQAHDELHKFLMKLSPNIEELRKGNLETAKHALEESKNTLKLFQNYFK
ncbi:MAG: hypothetical protein OEZ13_02105 [Spirochaetia bacterium]|nr:hypothetical protein [Spirochaetia bacterium]